MRVFGGLRSRRGERQTVMAGSAGWAGEGKAAGRMATLRTGLLWAGLWGFSLLATAGVVAPWWPGAAPSGWALLAGAVLLFGARAALFATARAVPPLWGRAAAGERVQFAAVSVVGSLLLALAIVPLGLPAWFAIV